MSEQQNLYEANEMSEEGKKRAEIESSRRRMKIAIISLPLTDSDLTTTTTSTRAQQSHRAEQDAF